jgi:hypothetical protein
MFPMAGFFLGEVDALDWHGLWRRFDAPMVWSAPLMGRSGSRIRGW